MPKVKIEIIGASKLKLQLERLSDNLAAETLERAALAGAEIVREDASRRAPRQTGKLARSIVAEVASKSRNEVSVHVGPSEDAFYGMFVEFGHAIKKSRKGSVLGHVPAKPFLRPAFDENEDRVKNEVGRVLRAALLKGAKS